jgi:diguanylate cyclase (GGDEF)-like protein
VNTALALKLGSFTAAVLDAIPDATAVLDRSGTIIAVNSAWRMFALDNGGLPETTGVGVSYLEVCDRAAAAGCLDAAEVLLGLRSVLAGETVESDHEYSCPSPSGSRWFTSRITPIGGPIGGALASHVNISRRKKSELELAHQASHDPLTGLANRVLFAEKLAEALVESPGRRRVPDVGLLYIDLDRFKPVNDIYGHNAGDEILQSVAYRLMAQVRPHDTVGRLGGDEFAVCAPRIDAAALSLLARRIDRALTEPHRVHGRSVVVKGSIGVYFGAAGDGAAQALESADQAMYAIKNLRPHRISTAG